MFYTYLLVDPRDDTVFYVGKGKGQRCKKHIAYAARGDHWNPKVGNKIEKLLCMGLHPQIEKIFSHEDEWPCYANEIAAIVFYGRSSLCNLTDGGDGNTGSEPYWLGKQLSDEHKEKISARALGRLASEETKAEMSRVRRATAVHGEAHYMFGRKASAETKRKLSAIRTGEGNPNFGKHFPGRRLSSEHRAKIASALLGHECNVDTRIKISQANSGRKWSEEAKNEMSLARKGMPKSAEHRAKISAALREHFAHREQAATEMTR
jgi:hypothetical protein